MTCTRCEGTGFLNCDQLPVGIIDRGADDILIWIRNNHNHDVQVCDCCGDGEYWYGEAGEHYVGGDEPGPHGFYAYNGGLPECN